jgi:hypothetical protein
MVARLDSTATARFTVARMLNLSGGAGRYQPLTHSRDIRRCPLLNLTTHNRHTPVTERSVALPAPRRAQVPKFSGRIYASTYREEYRSTTHEGDYMSPTYQESTP